MTRSAHLTTITASALLFLLAGISFYTYTVNTVLTQTKRRAVADSRGIMEEDGLLQDVVSYHAGLIDGHIVVVDSGSRRLADSRDASGSLDGRFFNKEIIEARRLGTAVGIDSDPHSSETTVAVANRMDRPSGAVVVYIAYPVPELRNLRPIFAAFGSGMLIAAAAMMISAGRFLARRLKRPIRTLVQHTGNALSGGFRKISVDTGDEEVARLVKHFNLLVDRYNEMMRSDDRKYSRISTLLSNLNTGILMVDTDNQITLVNPMAEGLLNLDKLSLFGIRSVEGPCNSLLDTILDLTLEVNSKGRSVEKRLEAPNERILDVSVDPIVGKYVPHEAGGAMVIIRDVTEIRQMERLKDEFVANVSHELRTPLTVISGFVETLKNGTVLSPEDRSTALEIIDIETERMKSQVSELLHLSRIAGDMGHLRLGTIDASAIVAEVVQSLRPMAQEKNLDIEMLLPGENVRLRGLEGWYRQIVLNLFGNAIKYTPEGGSIRIELGDDGNEVCLEVKDDGIGIPEDQVERIFDRFYRVDGERPESPQGSGLGLTIARHIIEELDGRITVESRLESGSSFRAIIPRRGDGPGDRRLDI